MTDSDTDNTFDTLLLLKISLLSAAAVAPFWSQLLQDQYRDITCQATLPAVAWSDM